MGVNPELLGEIAQLRKADSPVWKRFAEWCELEKVGKANYVSTGGEQISALFGYLTTKDTALYRIAWKLLAPKIWRDPNELSRGLRPLFGTCPDADFCDDHAAAGQGGALIADVATLFDWGYDQLSAEQRREMVAWLNAACEYTQTRNNFAGAHFRNDGAYIMLGTAAAAFATMGENPREAQLMRWFRDDWTQTLRALDIMGKGGAMAEGNAYGEATSTALISIANFVWYATGEDLFRSHPWFQKRLGYDAFTIYPNPPQNPKDILEAAAIGGDDDRGPQSWHTIEMRANGLALARHFSGTDEANLWNWVFRQPQSDFGNDAWYELFFYSKPAPLKIPKQLSWYDPSLGFVYIRSSWKSPDATWISFWAGPHLDIHQHLDQGAFTVFKRRDLAIKSGNYDWSPLNPHVLAYYSRTVSANTLLIGNPDEYFAGFVGFLGCGGGSEHTLLQVPGVPAKACPPNDGGERTAFPQAMVVFDVDDYYKHRNNYDYARVTNFRDNEDAVMWTADLTNAYTNPRYTPPNQKPKVTRVWRRFVYLRKEDVLLVADQVTSTDERFRKSWLLHAADHFDVGGTVKEIAAGESIHSGVRTAAAVMDDREPGNRGQTTFDLREGYAQLTVETLLPRDFSYRLTGGREASATEHVAANGSGREGFHFHRHIKDFWVEDYSAGHTADHLSANWPPGYPQEMSRTDTTPAFAGGYGRWRIAVEPARQAKEETFLNLLVPALKRGEAAVQGTAIDTPTSFGASIQAGRRKIEVLFPRNKLELPTVK